MPGSPPPRVEQKPNRGGTPESLVFKAPAELLERARAMAEAQHISFSELVARALSWYLDELEEKGGGDA